MFKFVRFEKDSKFGWLYKQSKYFLHENLKCAVTFVYILYNPVEQVPAQTPEKTARSFMPTVFTTDQLFFMSQTPLPSRRTFLDNHPEPAPASSQIRTLFSLFYRSILFCLFTYPKIQKPISTRRLLLLFLVTTLKSQPRFVHHPLPKHDPCRSAILQTGPKAFRRQRKQNLLFLYFFLLGNHIRSTFLISFYCFQISYIVWYVNKTITTKQTFCKHRFLFVNKHSNPSFSICCY